jgi:hypothetical protein
VKINPRGRKTEQSFGAVLLVAGPCVILSRMFLGSTDSVSDSVFQSTPKACVDLTSPDPLPSKSLLVLRSWWPI